MYATLKDESSSINIVKFKLTEDFQNGNMVMATGNIEFYSKNGNINFLCNHIELVGEGLILKKLETLKQKYTDMGYFINKKKFPENIKSIGIVTATSGAALQDILFVLNSNKFDGSIYIKNSPVQGVDCPKGICSGIKFFNEFLNKSGNKVDLIMITRGGGSIDDLMGFSDSSVIEEIHKSDLFVMSAVGHEVDNMLSDYVADIRAPTPSIGAEMISKSGPNILLKIESYKDKCIMYDNFIKNRFINVKKSLVSTKKKMYNNFYESNNKKINIFNDTIDKLLLGRFSNIRIEINNIKSTIDFIKNSEYNAVILKKNKIIKSIDDITNNIYTIKIGGKTKKIEIKIIN